MYITPILPIDTNGVIDEELLELAEQVCVKSAALAGGHNTFILNSIKELLRKTNSYYSNKIESEGTHPLDIEKAMRKDFSKNEHEKKLQFLSLAHIEVQRFIELYAKEHADEVFTKKFILQIHKEFYSKDKMSSFLEIKNSGTVLKMKPGELRENDVFVGRHIAPKFSELNATLNAFENFYKIPPKSRQSLKLLYALSSHHRLLWIHPFLDGNGRVSRLFLDATLLCINLEGYGLWNISRGLARDSDEYKKYLSLADMPLQGITDGKGPLSLRGLSYYLKYMLTLALEQIEFMSKNLQLSSLGNKIDKYVMLSEQGVLGSEPLPKYASVLFRELLIDGEIARGKVKEIINKKDRTATTLIKTLLQLDYIESDTPKSAIRLKLNTNFASFLMPDLIPSR